MNGTPPPPFAYDRAHLLPVIDKEGWSPLHVAAQEKHFEVVKILLDKVWSLILRHLLTSLALGLQSQHSKLGGHDGDPLPRPSERLACVSLLSLLPVSLSRFAPLSWLSLRVCLAFLHPLFSC